jgi:hypothetical protein
MSIRIWRERGACYGAPNWVPVALVAGIATAFPAIAAARRVEIFMMSNMNECQDATVIFRRCGYLGNTESRRTALYM